jgi:prevent-host-death family protein
MKTRTKSAKTRVRVKTLPAAEVKAPRIIPAGQFKAQCLAIIDEVHKRHEQVIITKYGKPMARLVPENKQPKSLFGFMRGKGRIVGDIISPAFPEDDWESEA